MKTATKNTTATATTTNVCTDKLSECLAQWEIVKEAESTKLGAWVAIGKHILEDGQRGLQAEFIRLTGANKGDVSSAVKVAYAHAESLANDDDGFDWEDYGSLKSASIAARAYLSGDDVPVKSKVKVEVSADISPEQFLKAKGAKAAMKFALEVMALASK